MKKVVFGVILVSVSLNTSCMQKDKQLTIMNISDKTLKVVVKLENGEFWPSTDLKRRKAGKESWRNEYDFGWGFWYDCQNPQEQFEVHPGKFKMGALGNPKKEEIDRKIKEEHIEGEAEKELCDKNAMRGQLDFYKDENLIGSLFIGIDVTPYRWSFDFHNPLAHFCVYDNDIVLRHIWWHERISGDVIKIFNYDPRYRYPNVGEHPEYVATFGDGPLYEDDPNNPRPVVPEPSIEYKDVIYNMTPEDPAPEDGCCRIW